MSDTMNILSTVRPRRSALYMPGANIRALEKARSLAADVLILDLEDAVAPDAKVAARQQVAAALRTGFGHREVVVRINGLHSPWGHDDLAAVALLDADAILLPKVESGTQIRELAELLRKCGAPARLRIWAMIETPIAIFRLSEIAGAHALLETLVLGTSDLVKDLHARHTPGRAEVHTALTLSVLAARAFNLSVLDGVHLALDDQLGLRGACEQGRNMGFDGKTLIHPSQLPVTNEIFGPSASEIDEAKRRIVAYEAALAAGGGVAVLDGKLVEELHVQDARRILVLARAIDAAQPVGPRHAAADNR